MKNRDLILMFVDKSTNAFRQILGLTEEDKLKTALTITQSTIQDSFDINSNELSKKSLAVILEKGLLDLGQAQLLTNLHWTKAEILLKLNRPRESMKQYNNALQLLHWKEKQPIKIARSERKNKISELESIIATLKLTDTLNF